MTKFHFVSKHAYLLLSLKLAWTKGTYYLIVFMSKIEVADVNTNLEEKVIYLYKCYETIFIPFS
jgi:hypothetical protein